MTDNEVLVLLGRIKGCVWGEDIPSPTIPEYVEHHNSIQRILKTIETIEREVEDDRSSETNVQETEEIEE